MKKLIDLFCGTGGFSKGFENSKGGKYQTILGVDMLPISLETFKLNHKKAKSICEDIRKVRRSEIAETLKLKRGKVDIIIGGPPCQGFSSIRPFRSSNDDDPRNTLFEEFASFVNYFRPNYFVLENVVGLVTHKEGNTLSQMLECFKNIGYDCDWRILNAAHFGIPQKRERFILIGAEKGGLIKFPIPNYSYNGQTVGYKDKARLIKTSNQQNLFFNTHTSEILLPAITVNDAISDLTPLLAGEKSDKYLKDSITNYQKERRKELKKLTLHDATAHSSRMLEIIKHSGKNINSIPKHLISSGFSTSYSRLNGNEPSVTVTVNFVHPSSNKCIHPKQDRALTPREGARLQSFDDDFLFAGNRSQVVKQIGNAVPPLLGKVIAETIDDNN